MKNIEVKRVGYHLYHLTAKEGFLLESLETGKRYSEIQSCNIDRWRSVEATAVQEAEAGRPVKRIASFFRRIMQRICKFIKLSK